MFEVISMTSLTYAKTRIIHVGDGQYSQSSEDMAKRLLDYCQPIEPIDHILIYGSEPSMSIVFKRKRHVDMSDMRKINEMGTVESIATRNGQIRISVRID